MKLDYLSVSLNQGNQSHRHCESESVSCVRLCDPTGCNLPRLLHPWNSPGKNSGVGCQFLLQRIFPIQGSIMCLPHCRQTLYQLSHQGSFSQALRVYDLQFYLTFYLFFNFFNILSSFWPSPVRYGILTLPPGIKPVPPAVEVHIIDYYSAKKAG